MAPPLSMVPLHQHLPRPSLQARKALDAMETVLVQLGYTPLVNAAEWSIDARLYQERHWESQRLTGACPITAVCLRLHQPGPDSLWWTVEYPSRTPDEWDTPPSATATRRLAVLGDASLPPRPHDLGLVEYLACRKDFL